ncbi:hypothetical protein GCM10023238_07970 [Streptomyces heliomycini]
MTTRVAVDSDRPVLIAVAVPCEDHVEEGTGRREIPVLVEAGVAEQDPAIHLVVGETHLPQGLEGIGDAVAGSLGGWDRVEGLPADHSGYADAPSIDVGDVQAAEQSVAGVGIDGVGADSAPVKVGFEVVGPAVVARGQHVVQLEQDLPLDGASGEAVVAAAFEEVAAVHDERGRAQRVEVGQEGRGVVEGGVDVRRGNDLVQVPVVGGHGVTSQMSAPRVRSLPVRSAWPRRSWSRAADGGDASGGEAGDHQGGPGADVGSFDARARQLLGPGQSAFCGGDLFDLGTQAGQLRQQVAVAAGIDGVGEQMRAGQPEGECHERWLEVGVPDRPGSGKRWPAGDGQ